MPLDQIQVFTCDCCGWGGEAGAPDSAFAQVVIHNAYDAGITRLYFCMKYHCGDHVAEAAQQVVALALTNHGQDNGTAGHRVDHPALTFSATRT